jgi:hypothetical protein
LDKLTRDATVQQHLEHIYQSILFVTATKALAIDLWSALQRNREVFGDDISIADQPLDCQEGKKVQAKQSASWKKGGNKTKKKIDLDDGGL